VDVQFFKIPKHRCPILFEPAAQSAPTLWVVGLSAVLAHICVIYIGYEIINNRKQGIKLSFGD